MKRQTAYQLFVLATAATTIAGGELARRWMLKGTKREKDPLEDDEPAGFYPRNEIIWQGAKSIFLPVFGYPNWWLGNLGLRGAENIRKALETGKGTVVIANHTSAGDTFMPQLTMWFHGFKKLVEELYRHLIGMKFINRRYFFSFMVRGGPRIPMAPPTMLKLEFVRKLSSKKRRTHIRNAKRINTAAFAEVGQSLGEGYWIPMFLEGTRTNGEMVKVADEAAAALRNPGSLILPMAIVNMDRLWKPGSWIPIPYVPIWIIVGEPIPYEEADRRAKLISKKYGVSEDRALCYLVMRKIARLLIENDHPEYAGFYGKTRRERLGIGKRGNTRKKQEGDE